MTDTPHRTGLGSLVAFAVTMFAAHVSAQSPPTATEDLKRCKAASDQKARELLDKDSFLKWEILAASNTSKYDPTNGQCFGRIYRHTTKQNGREDHEADQVYDLQTGGLLAGAMLENGKRYGSIFDPDYKKPWLPSCLDGCPANFGDQTWQATEDYMNELVADPRKQ